MNLSPGTRRTIFVILVLSSPWQVNECINHESSSLDSVSVLPPLAEDDRVGALRITARRAEDAGVGGQDGRGRWGGDGSLMPFSGDTNNVLNCLHAVMMSEATAL